MMSLNYRGADAQAIPSNKLMYMSGNSAGKMTINCMEKNAVKLQNSGDLPK